MLSITKTASALVALLPLLTAVTAGNTNLMMNKDEGCILVASFTLKANVTSGANSTSSITVVPKWVQAVCDFGNQARIGTTKNQEEIQVVYGKLVAGKALSDTDFCVAGPQEVYVSGEKGYAPIAQQAFPMDGSQYLWSKDHLFNLTSAAVTQDSVQKLNVNCHSRNDTGNIDAILFGSNSDLIKSLPNPYDKSMQNITTFVNDQWASKQYTVTLNKAVTVKASPDLARRSLFHERRGMRL